MKVKKGNLVEFESPYGKLRGIVREGWMGIEEFFRVEIVQKNRGNLELILPSSELTVLK